MLSTKQSRSFFHVIYKIFQVVLSLLGIRGEFQPIMGLGLQDSNRRVAWWKNNGKWKSYRWQGVLLLDACPRKHK